MAPKVAFPAAFGILIGTCLFKILIPDEELLILKWELLILKWELLILKWELLIPKGELQLYRNHYLYAKVAAHIVNASSACNLVYVKILQTAQVVLVSTVGKVLARKIEREEALAMELHVGTGIHI